jgi:hypothetical protein
MDVGKKSRSIYACRFSAVFITLLLAVISTSGLTFAQGGNGNKYGIGKPAHFSDLPPGRLRNKLESLPPGAQQHALSSLQRLDFPAQDITSLHSNAEGDIYYADYGLASETETQTSTSESHSADALSDEDLFTLHSQPGSVNVLFLDFDGHILSRTAWNKDRTWGSGINPQHALPYDPSANDVPITVANFTTEERKRIHEIWHRVAEDFAPFDIDVTTEEPVVFTATTGHVLFTRDSDADGNAMPSQGSGGIAWIGVFGSRKYVSYYSPALVYYNNLSSAQSGEGDASLNAEIASHEFGHNLNLSHDGTATVTYYDGHDSGPLRWGPIMGKSYRDNVSQWSQGEYPGANNSQDDLAIIESYLGYAADEQGDTFDSAVALSFEADGNILVSDPETDPHNVLPDNKGIIEDRDDVDWWYLNAGAGPLTLTVTPAWHAFNGPDHISSTYRGANLDVSLELYDANLNLIDAGEPDDETYAMVAATTTEGRYYLRIEGVGSNLGEGYTDYASIGMYFIEGSYQPAAPDTTAPSPNPMSWATAPYATGADSMAMVATTASDPSGVEYNFICVAGATGCIESGWQASDSYNATGLAAETYYSWKIRVRDGAGNLTDDSYSMGDTTQSPAANNKGRGKPRK